LSQKISEREITIEPGHEPEDLIYHIEGNGGWKSWAAGCGLRIATSDDFGGLCEISYYIQLYA